MAVFGAIIQALMRPLLKAGCHLAFPGAVGSKLVGYDPSEQAMALDQRLQKPFRGTFVTSGLQDFIQNDPVLIYRSPEPANTPRDRHPDLGV